MNASLLDADFSYTSRLETLRARKREHTREKQRVRGAMDFDDHGLILPPQEMREIVRSVSGSGVAMTDVLMTTFRPKPNHPSGGFFGPRACGENFRALLECHPVFVDPAGSLAGAYMVNFMSYRTVAWKPEFDYSHIEPFHQKYQILHAIGGVQHFCQDMAIGLELGWGGLLEKVRRCRDARKAASGERGEPGNGSSQAPGVNEAEEFYAGLEHVLLGMQNWIARHAEAATGIAAQEGPAAENLREIAEINRHLVAQPPRTFREACQWMLWHLLAARMYNGSGSLGRLDVLLRPYYDADVQAGRITDEEAIFHIANLLLRDSAYLQLGGLDASGEDVTSPVSFLILEAAHRLRIPANVGVCVGEGVDRRLLRRGVEVLLEDRTGVPKFLGADNTTAGFVRNGFALELARERVYAGCHWLAIPGREYGLADIIKINFAVIFDVALREMLGESGNTRSGDTERGSDPDASVAGLWDRFIAHLRRAVEVVAEGIDFHCEHMHEVFPDLVLDLLSHGVIEKGLDASHGGVEFYTFGVDGAALATAADSFAAVEARIEKGRRMTWPELLAWLDSDWNGREGEAARLLMQSVPRYGSGGSSADRWAGRIVRAFAEAVKERPTPSGRPMIPGLFSWALSIPLGKRLGATPDGRHAGAPISHGANPNNGFRRDGAPTALAVAVAAVQPGYGNTAPLQIDLGPGLPNTPENVANIAALILGHFELGGTQININVLDKDQLLEAHRDPGRFPDLVVRVTGFSAYFASLSPEFRQMVIDRVVGTGGTGEA